MSTPAEQPAYTQHARIAVQHSTAEQLRQIKRLHRHMTHPEIVAEAVSLYSGLATLPEGASAQVLYSDGTVIPIVVPRQQLGAQDAVQSF
jgi:hypothetical protein